MRQSLADLLEVITKKTLTGPGCVSGGRYILFIRNAGSVSGRRFLCFCALVSGGQKARRNHLWEQAGGLTRLETGCESLASPPKKRPGGARIVNETNQHGLQGTETPEPRRLIWMCCGVDQLEQTQAGHEVLP